MMKNGFLILCMLILITSLFPASSFVYAEEIINIYVSVNGNDAADGSISSPVSSLNRARELVRSYNTGESKTINVLFYSGTYPVDATTQFTAEDSGFVDHYINYKAYGDGEVTFSGAAVLDTSGFTYVTDPQILLRLCREARTKVLALNLQEQGLNFSANEHVFPFIYLNGKEQIQSRYPNEGYLTADTASGVNTFVYSDDNISRWENAAQAYATGSFGATYFWKSLKINSVSNGTITLSDSVRKNTLWFARNLLEEIDMPGEWFVDTDTDVLYYYPPKAFSNDVLEIVRAQNFPIIKMTDAKNIHFEGFTFTKASQNAIVATGAQNLSIKNCTFSYLQGDYALNVSGSNIAVEENFVYGCGGGFITFSGGDRKTLTNGNITVKNNRISSCGYNLEYINGVIVSGQNSTVEDGGVGNEVRNNVISDCTTVYAISVPGNNNKVLYNEIYNQGKQIDDGGAIYFGKSNTKYGIEVAYNYLHDFDKTKEYCGIYADDGYGGIQIHHNVLADMKTPVLSGVGMNNQYNYNLAIRCDRGLYLGTRMSWSSDIYGNNGSLYSELNRMLQLYGDAYKAAYPDLENAILRQPYFAPYHTEVVGNAGVGTGGETIYARPNHSYKKADGSLTVKGEDAVSAITNEMKTANDIDELKVYGKYAVNANGEDLNGTALGNPAFDYSDTLFKDAERQNYTLNQGTSLAAAIPALLDINMDMIGISGAASERVMQNKDIAVALKSPENQSENVNKDGLLLSWDRVENATKYNVTVSKNADLSNPVIQQTILENGNNNCFPAENLESSRQYYWAVTATGMARQNPFMAASDTYSFTTAASGYIEKEFLNYAIGILEKEIQNVNDNLVSYDDETVISKLISTKEAAKALALNPATQSAADNMEDTVYADLAEAFLYRSTAIPVITRCAADNSTSIVYVEGTGFFANQMISVLVTNPNFLLENVKNDRSTKTIQYTDIVLCDANGAFQFSFDTKVNDLDMPGVYHVYIGAKGRNIISNAYMYGTVEVGDISFFDTSGNAISDLKEYKNRNINVKCVVDNRLSSALSPNIFTGVYEDNKIMSVHVESSLSVPANSKKELIWEITVPEQFSDNSVLKVLLFSDFQTLKPLTTSRIIHSNHEELP